MSSSAVDKITGGELYKIAAGNYEQIKHGHVFSQTGKNLKSRESTKTNSFFMRDANGKQTEHIVAAKKKGKADEAIATEGSLKSRELSIWNESISYFSATKIHIRYLSIINTK